MTKTQTPFEQQMEIWTSGKPQIISINGVLTPYHKYQLICHKRDISLYVKGIKITRTFKISDYKSYYGLKGSGQALLDQFLIIFNKYMD